MITEISIKNFKSIQDVKLKLGRVTVFIGENGSGKSNILEAIAFASASANDKLDNEFLASRGIRVTSPEFMTAAFERTDMEPIEIAIKTNETHQRTYKFTHKQDADYPRWEEEGRKTFVENAMNLGKIIRQSEDEAVKQFKEAISTDAKNQAAFDKFKEDILKLTGPSLKHPQDTIEKVAPDAPNPPEQADELIRVLASSVQLVLLEFLLKNVPTGNSNKELSSFLIYSPENSSLRTFEREGQILPLGIKGEGLLRLLKVLSDKGNEEYLSELKEHLRIISWFDDFLVAPKSTSLLRENNIRIRDRYLSTEIDYFDQRSANEGFLFLLFYFALFISSDTPQFFAIDNIDASLNPKLCSELLKKLVPLAAKHNKQVIFTTHNPAVLDGLDLNDDEQRLLVIYRNSKGHTKARRVTAPEPISGEAPIKLSEAFLRGLIGGLPQNF
jgi:AAA15 family ATPase/GTPase